MNSFIFLLISSLLLAKNLFSDFLVSTKILGIANKEKLVLKVDVKNNSNKTIKILKNRLQDYRWDNGEIKSLGNYIIEIEKYENGQYSLFNPSADIGAIPPKQEYISIESEQSISDTLHIMGYYFTRYNEARSGFPAGIYRLRAYFYPDIMSEDKIANCSNWIEFKIE